MTLIAPPIRRHLPTSFRRVLELFETHPNPGGQTAMATQDRDPIAASRRAEEALLKIPDRPTVHKRQGEDIDQRAADMRDAAILNTILLAKTHGLSQEITEADVERWRKIRAITNDLASGANEAEAVPIGFGAPVRARQTEVLMKIAAKISVEAPEAPPYAGMSHQNGEAA